MKKLFSGLLFAAGLGVMAGASAQDMSAFVRVEHGRQMATAADCAGCHTVKGGKPFAGGVPLQTPFGTLLAPNITPDANTGIGAWTQEQFLNAMWNGIGRHGENLYPAMPYTSYTKMSKSDVLDILAYLQTVEPVSNKIEANQLPFPFNIRASLKGWNALQFKAGRFEPQADKSMLWNRGAYLAEGAAHCAECHTPRNVIGGLASSKAYQGGELQGWFAPPLGGKSWSEAEWVQYLRSGTNMHSTASGPMAEVITNSTFNMPESDLRAIAAYFRDMPEPVLTKAVAQDHPAMRTGAAIYTANCVACHAAGGKGVPNMFPALAGNGIVQSSNAANAIRLVLEGGRAAATNQAPTAPAMPSFATRLSNQEVADVVTYIRNSWGNRGTEVATDAVADSRKTLRGH